MYQGEITESLLNLMSKWYALTMIYKQSDIVNREKPIYRVEFRYNQKELS